MTVTTTFRGSGGSSGGLTPASLPTIYNVVVSTANTEVTQALNPNTKKITIRCRGDAAIKLSFAAGQSGTDYLTIPRGTTFSEDQLNFSGSIYFQTSKSTQVVEILEWT